MRELSAKRLALGWIVIASACAMPNEAASVTQISAVFTIHVRNYANVDSKTLAQAEKVASEIFHHAGVGVEWDHQAIEIPLEIKPEGADTRQFFGLSHLWLNIYTQAMTEALRLPDKVMGVAPGRGPDRQTVYVFYDYLEALAERQVLAMRKGDITLPASRGQLLGHMIAHEFGHLLLNQPSHSPVGIMRGDWDLKDLQDAAYGTLNFTPSQAAVLCVEVARRAEQSTVIVNEQHDLTRQH